MNTHDTWAALGEIHRALHQIMLTADERTRDGITPSELQTLDEITEQLGSMLNAEVV